MNSVFTFLKEGKKSFGPDEYERWVRELLVENLGFEATIYLMAELAEIERERERG